MADRSKILDSMATELWHQASGLDRDPTAPGERRARRLTPPSAARKAADDLAALYENFNDESLQSISDRWADDEWNFGRRLVRAALERAGDFAHMSERRRSRKSNRQRIVDAGIFVPYFLIMLAKNGSELVWEGGEEDVAGKAFGRHERVNPKDPDEVPHTKSLAEVRRILAGIKSADRCGDKCPGWAVFDTNRGFEIQVCDECMQTLPKHLRLSDDDVAQLPEAQKALREVQAEWLEENPNEQWYEIEWPVNDRHQPDPQGQYTNRGRYPHSELTRMLTWLQQHGVHESLRRVTPVPAPRGRPPGVPNRSRR